MPLLGELKILTSIWPSNTSGWYFASWRSIKIASVIPLFVFFVSWRLVPESPRWLVCKSRTKEAAEILMKIATTNGAEVPDDLEVRLETIAERKGRTTSYGFFSLFSSPTLFFRTAMVAIGQAASYFAIYIVYINISDMANGRYLNMLIIAVIDLPGKVFGE